MTELKLKTGDGGTLLLRLMTPADEDALRTAISRLSNQSRYLRFFNGAAQLPAHVLKMLVSVDGSRHIAWVAVDLDDETRPIVGAVHAIRETSDERLGDFSIGLLDAWHGRGLARILIALLAASSRGAGFEALHADVLWENKKGRALMGAVGAKSDGSDGTAIQFQMPLDTVLETLNAKHISPAMDEVLDWIGSDEFPGPPVTPP
jgi:RimJ/RimL family protein N-acetyltransferase